MFDTTENEVDHVIQENKDLKKALKLLKNTLDRTIDDLETLKNIHEDYKQHYSKLKEEKLENMQRIQVILNEKKDQENHFESIIKNLKNQIDEKQREIEYIQSKVLPSLDQDMIRVRLINELEAPHRIELEAKQMEIERLQEKQYDLKRQLELFKTKYEVITTEAQRDIRELREKHKIELKDLMLELQINQEKTVENKKEKHQAKMFKKESEELKTLLMAKDEEIFNIKKSLDQEKSDRSDQIEKLVNEMEELREQRRNLQTQIENQQDHILDLENEIKHTYKKQQNSTIQQSSPTQRFDTSPKKNINYQVGELHQLRDNESLIKSLQQKILEQKNKFEDEIQINRQSEKKMEDQIDKLRREKRELQSEYQKFVSESQDKISEERRKFLDIQNRCKDLERDKNQLSDNIRKLENQANDSKENKHSMINRDSSSNNREIETLKKKNNSLKQKLKEANQKIMKLLSEKIIDKKREQDIQIMNQHNAIIKNIPTGQQQQYPSQSINPIGTQQDYINQYNTQQQNQGIGNLYQKSHLNVSAPNALGLNISQQQGLTNNYANQNTGNYYTVTNAIRHDLDHHRDRLTNIKGHIEDLNKISNQQFYKPY